MRRVPISPDEHYHLFNRGVLKRNIFPEDRDRIRFLFSLLYFQSPLSFTNPGFHVRNYYESSTFDPTGTATEKVATNRTVELIAFCLMPNHFHLLVREAAENGIAGYMQRVLNAYTKYFNAKYKSSGHLFQGPYQAVHVESNEQLLHLSAYIHRNPRELKGWKDREERYPWSSGPDYLEKNRWGKLLLTDIIAGQFSSPEEYADFLRTSSAKTDSEDL